MKEFVVFPDSIQKLSVMPDFSGMNWQSISSEVDTEGVALLDYDARGIRGVSGKQRYPYYISIFGHRHFSEFIKNGNQANLLLAFKQIDYLVKEFKSITVDGEEVGIWEVNFDLKYQYNAKKPWRCGLNQAFCMAAILNAYQITRDFKYIEMFNKAIKAYKFEITSGGLSYKTKSGGLFFQEVVTNTPHHILNGHMSALIIIHECMLFTRSVEAKKIFELGVIGLKDMLPKYDQYNYSLYSLSPNPSLKNHFNIASPFYHNIHIAQLRSMAEISNEKIFNKYLQKWENETGNTFEFMWTALYILFKDTMKVAKSI
jgi:hypothetical protein